MSSDVASDAPFAEAPARDRQAGLAFWTKRLPPTEVAIRAALVVGVLFQIAESNRELRRYHWSLWYVSYEHGFVRRGLNGEILRSLVGGSPTRAHVHLVQSALAVAVLVAAAALVWLLCAQRTRLGYGLAALMVASPFIFDYVWSERRPDLVGPLIVLGVGLAFVLARPPVLLVSALAGCALGVGLLSSEAAPLVALPWVILLTAGCVRSRSGTLRQSFAAVAVLVMPVAVAALAVLRFGRATGSQVARIDASAPRALVGDIDGTVFGFLGHTVSESLAFVWHRGGGLGVNLVAILLLSGLVGAVSWRGFEYAATLVRWSLWTRAIRNSWLLLLVTCVAVMFALGVDWMRWYAMVGFCCLAAFGALVLLFRESSGPPSCPDSLAAPVGPTFSWEALVAVLVGTYLLVLPPLPVELRSLRTLVLYLLNQL